MAVGDGGDADVCRLLAVNVSKQPLRVLFVASHLVLVRFDRAPSDFSQRITIVSPVRQGQPMMEQA